MSLEKIRQIGRFNCRPICRLRSLDQFQHFAEIRFDHEGAIVVSEETICEAEYRANATSDG